MEVNGRYLSYSVHMLLLQHLLGFLPKSSWYVQFLLGYSQEKPRPSELWVIKSDQLLHAVQQRSCGQRVMVLSDFTWLLRGRGKSEDSSSCSQKKKGRGRSEENGASKKETKDRGEAP